MKKQTSAILGLALAATIVLTGCTNTSGSNETPPVNTTQQTTSQNPWPGATVIDVRTPAEYDQGHVPGSVNIDISSPDFNTQIDELVQEKGSNSTYVVYCRSGNRSAQATQILQSKNLNVEDAGGLQDVQNAGATLTQ